MTIKNKSAIVASLNRFEREVYLCLMRGMADKDIAQALNMSVSKIKQEVKKLRKKFGVTTRRAFLLNNK